MDAKEGGGGGGHWAVRMLGNYVLKVLTPPFYFLKVKLKL